MRAALLLLALLLASPAVADPVALRAPGQGRELVVEAGWPSISVAWWSRGGFGLALDVGTLGQAAGLSGGGRFVLTEGPLGWGVDAYVAGGLELLIADPGLTLTFTPALSVGSRGVVIATLSVAAPMALRLGEQQARLPVQAELRLGARPGPVSFGVRGALGAVLSPGQPVAASLQWSLWIALTPPATGS